MQEDNNNAPCAVAITLKYMNHGIIGFVVLWYSNKPKYWDRQARTNSVDPDQMP